MKAVPVKISTFASSLQPEHTKVKQKLAAVGQTGEAEQNLLSIVRVHQGNWF